MVSKPHPFVVEIPDDVLEDLSERLRRTRLPKDFANDDWAYGTNAEYLRELVDYWIHQYDWRAQEKQMNRFAHFRADVDGLPVHFIHERGHGPDPQPLLLTHGWPWTFWDYRKVIGPLTDPASHGGDPADAFDVVIPSLPGFGFSTPVETTGVNWIRTADLWAALMRDHLGYDRFFASGADWGTGITSQLGHKHGATVAGIHVANGHRFEMWNGERPWDLFGAVPADLPAEVRHRMLARQKSFAGHVTSHILGSQTLANALNDSPAGLCSWLVERRRAWSDCDGDVERVFSKDDLLTTVMLYWVTESFGTSARFYREAANHPWSPSHDQVPTVGVPSAVSVFVKDTSVVPTQEALSRVYDLRQYRVHENGGHFVAAESPETLVADLRDAFRPIR